MTDTWEPTPLAELSMTEEQEASVKLAEDTAAYRLSSALRPVKTNEEFNDIIDHFLETKQIIEYQIKGSLFACLMSDSSYIFVDPELKDEFTVILPMHRTTALRLLMEQFPFTKTKLGSVGFKKA